MANAGSGGEQFPQYPPEHQLEDLSLDELRPLLRGSFVIRDQRTRDFGVDLTIEAVQNDQATNYTTAVQLKARSNWPRNTDGSYSLPIASPTVHYLLSAPTALVVLYLPEQNAFFWVHVISEIVRLEAEGVNYRDQGSVTLRLSNRLTAATVQSLRDDLLERGRVARDVRHRLAGMSVASMLHVDAAGSATTTDEVERDFLKRGWRLAARGELAEVERLFGLLAASARTGARAQLIMAHAHACTAQLYGAQLYANRARQHVEDLPPDELDLLDLIEIGCDRVLRGATDEDVLLRTQVIRDRAKLEMRMQLDVLALRQGMTACADPNQFGSFAARASALCAESAKTLGPRHPATLAARVLVQDLSGRVLGISYAQLQLTCVYGDTPLGLRMRRGVPVASAIGQMSETIKAWFERNNNAKHDCIDWPLLELEVDRGDLLMQIVLLRNTRIMSITDRKEIVLNLEHEPVATLLASITALRDRAQRMGVDDVEIQARLLRTELLDLADSQDEMKREAIELIARARASGFSRIEEEARAFASGQSMFRTMREQMLQDNAFASDEELVARATPAKRDEIADALCEVLHVPVTRRDVLRDEIERIATGYLLQESFCQHFEIAAADVGKTDDLLYARRPACVCRCAPRRLRTLLGSPNWQALVAEFRRNYCDGCSMREPHVPPL